MRLGKGHPW